MEPLGREMNSLVWAEHGQTFLQGGDMAWLKLNPIFT